LLVNLFKSYDDAQTYERRIQQIGANFGLKQFTSPNTSNPKAQRQA